MLSIQLQASYQARIQRISRFRMSSSLPPLLNVLSDSGFFLKKILSFFRDSILLKKKHKKQPNRSLLCIGAEIHLQIIFTNLVLVLPFGLQRICYSPSTNKPSKRFHVSYHRTPDCSRLRSPIDLKIILMHVLFPFRIYEFKVCQIKMVVSPLTIPISLSLVCKYPS